MKPIRPAIQRRPCGSSCLHPVTAMLSFLSAFSPVWAGTVARQELSQCRDWVKARLEAPAEGPAQRPPFSFVYGDHAWADSLKDWKREYASKPIDAQRTGHELSWSDPVTGLKVRCVAVEYCDFPTVEWTLYLKNNGAADTPILKEIQALDLLLARSAPGDCVLHHAVGSPCAPNDYQPLQTSLEPRTRKRLSAAGGRPTNTDLCYFDVQWAGEGLVIGLGWPGQWAAEFAREDTNYLHIVAGQELTHFTLHPGEQVRTPLIVLQFSAGDWIHAQNVWRRWMLAHNVPRPGGKLPQPELFGCSSHFYAEMTQANQQTQIQWIDRYAEERVKIGHWWMDAGWYVNKTGWPETGTWEVDLKRFPGGLRPISDHAHSQGVKTIVWFEPERVAPATWLAETHPEWILGGKGGGLLNLGNPEARHWLTDHVDKLMTEQGIDLYRQDFNIDPLAFWRGNDAPDRQGITEIRHVEGLLAYWDELRRRHPAMFIDVCASGGRRNDLESLRRAIPLWRTDWRCEPIGTQCHTYGISLWVPLSGTGAADVDRYIFRSNLSPFCNCLWDIRRRDLDYDLMRRLTGQFARIAPYWFGDYYPLTPFSTEKDAWMAWQFDLPEKGEGMIQVFRRPESPFYGRQLKLQGLLPAARYALTDVDTDSSAKEYTGKQLTDEGLAVAIRSQPGARLLTYKRIE